jgi:hypothetical protein
LGPVNPGDGESVYFFFKKIIGHHTHQGRHRWRAVISRTMPSEMRSIIVPRSSRWPSRASPAAMRHSSDTGRCTGGAPSSDAGEESSALVMGGSFLY